MGRFVLSKTDDWTLVHDHQDIRGWDVQDRAGNRLGTVAELIANTESELVESIVLDTGREYPARDVTLDDGVVYVEGVPAATDADPIVKKYDNARIRRRGAATRGDWSTHDALYQRHHAATYGGTAYEAYAPAYRHGHTFGANPAYRTRAYDEAEPELRRSYEREHGEGTFEKVKHAVKHAFDHARSH